MAEADLEQAIRLARQMVGRWSTSDAIGPDSVLLHPQDEQGLPPGVAGPSRAQPRALRYRGPPPAGGVLHEGGVTLIRANRARQEGVAQVLLERETVEQADASQTAGLCLPGTARSALAIGPAE